MSPASRTRDAAVWVLAATVLLVTIVWGNLTGLGLGGGHPFTYDDVALPRLVIAVVGVFAALLLVALSWLRSTAEDEPRVAFDLAWLPAVLLAVWSVVSALASSQGPTVWLGQSERLEGVVTIVLYALLFGVGLQVGTVPGALRRIAVALVAGATLLSVFGIVQMLEIDPTDYSVTRPGFDIYSAFSSTGNPNFLAGVLVLVLPIAVLLAVRTRSAVGRFGWWGAVTLLAIAFWGTESQGAWMAAVVQIAVAAAYLALARTSVKRRRGVAAGALVSVFAVGLALIVGLSVSGLKLGHSLTESGSGRVQLAVAALDAATAHPLVGYGPDTYLAAFRLHRSPAYVRDFGDDSTNNNAHSWIPQYAATTGFVGAALLAGALGLALLRARPRLDRAHDDAQESPNGAAFGLPAAVWLGALGYAVHMQFNVAMLSATVPFWLLLGMLVAARARTVPVRRLAASTAVGVSALLLVAGSVGAVRLVSADTTYLAARLAYNGAAEGDAAVLAQRASNLNPLSVKYSRGTAQALAERVFSQPQADAAQARATYATALAAYRRTLKRWPGDYASYCWLSALQASLGRQLDDPALRAAAKTTALRGSKFDSAHAELTRLAAGDDSSLAALKALSVPGLP